MGIRNIQRAQTVLSGTELDVTNDGTKTTFLPPSGDYMRFGDASTTSRSLNANDDVLITGELEVDGAAYFDGAFYVTGNAAVFDDVYTRDDKSLISGDGSDGILTYEGADANAKMLVWGLPHVDEDANNVAVLALVDRDAFNTDLGAGGIDLSGITEPTLALGNEATDAYVSLDAGDAGNGLYFKPAADEDVTLLKVGVTGTPTITWDESADAFLSTKAIENTDNAGTANTGVTAVEYGDGYNHLSVLTVSQVDALTLGDNAALADGYLLYTFPAGAVVVDYAYMSMAITAGSSDLQADTPDVGLGTVIASGAVATLDGTGTFEDIITGQTADDCNGTAEVKTALPTAGTPFIIASGDAHTLHFNAACTWSDDEQADLTADIAGTVVVAWRFLA